MTRGEATSGAGRAPWHDRSMRPTRFVALAVSPATTPVTRGWGFLRGPPRTGAVAVCPDGHQRNPVSVAVPLGGIPRAKQAAQLHIKSTPCPRHDAKPLNGCEDRIQKRSW